MEQRQSIPDSPDPQVEKDKGKVRLKGKDKNFYKICFAHYRNYNNIK